MSESSSPRCPQCAHHGLAVATVTLKALLARPLTEITATAYRFCPTATCPIVYFALDTDHAFSTQDVREMVYQKAPDDPTVFVCYCFRYTQAHVVAAAAHDAGHALVAAITVGIKTGACACDLRNPQGACCLGNIRARLRTPGTQPEGTSTDCCPG